MPLKNYSLLKGRAIDARDGTGANPHYQILVTDDSERYRIAVNVQSQDGSEVQYLVVSRFDHPILGGLPDIPLGLQALTLRPGGVALDYIRGNLLQPESLVPLPLNLPGADNDLNEKIGQYVQRAMSDEDAEVYAFGESWGPEANKRDRYFGFLPGRGIHDIHMNQGNPAGKFDRDNGPWQDGGLIFRFPAQDQWVAMFLKFQTQAWHTDDRTGAALDLSGAGPAGEPPADHPGMVPLHHVPTTDLPDGLVRIVAALVNDTRDPERETVTLLNSSAQPVSLAGWSIADKMKNRMPLDGQIGPGEALRLEVKAPVTLSNRGGIISLLDERGVKVHGVSYTREQAARAGQTLIFRA